MKNKWKSIIAVIALGSLIITVGLVTTLPSSTPLNGISFTEFFSSCRPPECQ
ncbi:MAG: hypothetical protein ACXADC_05090 [Candidatus Thorarchaeota archaeon]